MACLSPGAPRRFRRPPDTYHKTRPPDFGRAFCFFFFFSAVSPTRGTVLRIRVINPRGDLFFFRPVRFAPTYTNNNKQIAAVAKFVRRPEPLHGRPARCTSRTGEFGRKRVNSLTVSINSTYCRASLLGGANAVADGVVRVRFTRRFPNSDAFAFQTRNGNRRAIPSVYAHKCSIPPPSPATIMAVRFVTFGTFDGNMERGLGRFVFVYASPVKDVS